eukprot:523933-Ditylum_brightwellii.AAC.1
MATKDMGIILDPNKNESFSVYGDADFSGNLFKKTAMHDASTAKSRTGYIITYAGCPILWASKLQILVTLSTTEAEYVALSMAAKEAIVLMNFLQEIQDKGITKTNHTQYISCTMFKGNSGTTELTRVPKTRPRIKHVNLVYHHYRSYVQDGTIMIYPLRSDNLPADIFTNMPVTNLFRKQRAFLLGW